MGNAGAGKKAVIPFAESERVGSPSDEYELPPRVCDHRPVDDSSSESQIHRHSDMVTHV